MSTCMRRCRSWLDQSASPAAMLEDAPTRPISIHRDHSRPPVPGEGAAWTSMMAVIPSEYRTFQQGTSSLKPGIASNDAGSETKTAAVPSESTASDLGVCSKLTLWCMNDREVSCLPAEFSSQPPRTKADARGPANSAARRRNRFRLRKTVDRDGGDAGCTADVTPGSSPRYSTRRGRSTNSPGRPLTHGRSVREPRRPRRTEGFLYRNPHSLPVSFTIRRPSNHAVPVLVLPIPPSLAITSTSVRPAE